MISQDKKGKPRWGEIIGPLKIQEISTGQANGNVLEISGILPTDEIWGNPVLITRQRTSTEKNVF
jgi:hypothetical protein